jgi:prevent-host-death family protein
MIWQIQEAKQRFSEVIRLTEADGPQIVTRHGQEIAVIISITEYRRLRGPDTEFKDYLRSGPDLDDLDLSRPGDGPREIDLAGR